MSGADFDQDHRSAPQGNLTGLGIVASYGARFWSLVIGLGVFTGLSASAFVGLLRLVERITYGVQRPTLLLSVEASPHWRRLVALLFAAAIVVVGLRFLGRTSTGGTEVTGAIWLKSGRLPLFSSLARGVLSIVTVGMGVSLGREAAPQLAGAAFGSRIAEWAALPVWQRRLLVAGGAGAGFAAIYNVPLGGTLLALEVMLGSLALPLVLPALLMSLTATAVGWIFLGNRPIYHVIPDRFHASQLVFAILIGPIVGVVAVGWTRLITFATQVRPKGSGRLYVPFLAFGAVGLLSLHYPQLLGNGRAIVQLAILGNISLGLMVMLLILKPLVTALCLTTGSPGGLFTPTFAVGVLLAGVAGALWGHVWHGSVPGTYALIGGGAFLAAAMQGPLAGTVLVIELTGHLDQQVVPILIAVVEATIVSRRLGGASIYSARLDSGEVMASSPTANAASVAAVYALDEALPPNFSRGPEGAEP